MAKTGESRSEAPPSGSEPTPPQRASPWVPLAILAFVIVAGSAIWMLTH